MQGGSSFNALVRAMKQQVVDTNTGAKDPNLLFDINRLSMDKVQVFPDGELDIQVRLVCTRLIGCGARASYERMRMPWMRLQICNTAASAYATMQLVLFMATPCACCCVDSAGVICRPGAQRRTRPHSRGPPLAAAAALLATLSRQSHRQGPPATLVR